MPTPAPMTIDAALAADDPALEIAIRLAGKPIESMTEPEKVFWAVHYFLEDPASGSDFLQVVGEFARRYGPPELEDVVAEFDASSGLDPEWAERFGALEDAIRARLVEMATRNRAAFDLLPTRTAGR